jgi:hypothetical protein
VLAEMALSQWSGPLSSSAGVALWAPWTSEVLDSPLGDVQWQCLSAVMSAI